MKDRNIGKIVGVVLSCAAIAAVIVLLCILRSVQYLPDGELLQIAPLLAVFVAIGTFFALRTQKLRLLGDVLLLIMSVVSVVFSIILP